MKAKCKRCNKLEESLKHYIICFTCLFELDLAHKDIKRYERNEKNKTP